MKDNKFVYDSELSKKITTCMYFIINNDRMNYIKRWVLIGLMNYLTKCGSRSTYDKLNSFRVYPEKFKEWYGIEEMQYKFDNLELHSLNVVVGKYYDVTILWDNIMELRNNLIEAYTLKK